MTHAPCDTLTLSRRKLLFGAMYRIPDIYILKYNMYKYCKHVVFYLLSLLKTKKLVAGGRGLCLGFELNCESLRSLAVVGTASLSLIPKGSSDVIKANILI